MGMYTQFVIEAKIKKETPIEVLECLQDMVSGKENKLFTFDRNPLDNYCQSNEYPKSFTDLVLKAHGEIKNYWNDIDRFVEFIKPYVANGYLENGSFAKSIHEEGSEWTFYYCT